MFQPKTLQQSIMPILIANFILGIGILNSKRGRILNIIYSLIWLVISYFMIKTSMDHPQFYILRKKEKSFSDMTYLVTYYGNFCVLFVIPCSWLMRKHLKEAMMRIMMCEKAMDQMGLEKNYRKLCLYQLYYLLIVVTFILFTMIDYWTFDENTPKHIQFLIITAERYPIVLLYVSDVSFLHWVRYSKFRFEQLNNVLQRLLTTTPDSPQHKRVLKMKNEWNKTLIISGTQQDRGTKDNTDTMRAVKQVHLELIKSIKSANEAYGIQILLSMTMSFMCITNFLYDWIYWIDPEDEFQEQFILIIGWILFYASKIFVINRMCSLATVEAANTGDIICELYEPSTSKEFRAEIRDFTLQLIHNPLIFTACGFFNLDHTFIHGVFVSVTTFLIILIQDRPQWEKNLMRFIMEEDMNYTTSDIFATVVYP